MRLGIAAAAFVVVLSLLPTRISADSLLLKTGARIFGYFEGGTARLVKFRGSDGVVKDYDILSVQTLEFGEEETLTTQPSLNRSTSGTSLPVAPPPRNSLPAGVYSVGGGVSEPQPTYTILPGYSDDGRKGRIQGTVELLIVVKADGTVEFQSVRKSLGYVLDEKAIEAVKKWKFIPGKKDGVPVATLVSVSVNFSTPQ